MVNQSTPMMITVMYTLYVLPSGAQNHIVKEGWEGEMSAKHPYT